MHGNGEHIHQSALKANCVIDSTKVAARSREDIDDIEIHLYAALDNDTGSGDHWILMATLDRYGFRTNSPTVATHLAEEIIKLWYATQK